MFDTMSSDTGSAGPERLKRQARCLRRPELWVVLLSVYPIVVISMVPRLLGIRALETLWWLFLVTWPLVIVIAAVATVVFTLRRGCGLLGPLLAWASTALAVRQFPKIFRWL